MKIKLTPADHAWQNESSKYSKIRKYRLKISCVIGLIHLMGRFGWLEIRDFTRTSANVRTRCYVI